VSSHRNDRAGEPWWQGVTRHCYAADILVIGFSILLIGLALVFRARMPMWRAVVGTSSSVIAGLLGLAALHSRWPSRGVRFLHDWAFAPVAYLIYAETHWVTGPLHLGWLADDGLMAIDRALFGGNPIAWFARLSHPWLTEVAQVAYTLFYPLVVAVGVELYARRPKAQFQLFVFACASGFLTCYLGYLLVPAVGPRFTVYDFASIERDLPGVLFTPALRAFVNVGGLVPTGVSREAALALAHRDVFPSGHTLMTLVAIWWSWRFGLRVRWGITAIGTILVFATIYLRYHYAIDVLAGAAVAAACIALTPAVYRQVAARFRTRDASALSALPPMPAAGRLRAILARLNFRRMEECSTVIAWLDPRPGERILDIGSGDGSYDWRIARSGASVTGVDTHEARVATAQRCYAGNRTEFLLLDAEAIDFPESSFDKAVSLCVIEHLHSDERVLANVARSLKPRGRFVFSADSLSHPGVTEAERDRHRARYAVNTFYTIDLVGAKLARAGFEIESARYILSSAPVLSLVRLSWKLDDLSGVWAALRPLGYLVLGVVWRLTSLLPGSRRGASDGGMTLLVSARKIA
jgi:2-polyprenyl-3-methyl-5-hydroxy-6-metoxy-1,4-benzoquinol methylase/membrane-associated phospholipid phosphatase